LLQNTDLNGKVVLVRVDHNVVEKGVIKDPFRIDSTFGTIHHIASKGGFPVLMTHVGRTRDKKTGRVKTGPDTSVLPIVEYLNRKIRGGFVAAELPADPDFGIVDLDFAKLEPLVKSLKAREIGGIYLPNTRWFAGEESKDDKTKALAEFFAKFADVFANDAFGSWQPHASTFDIVGKVPVSVAGFLLQKELIGLERVLNPEKPFLGVVAGAKYDTKIGPLLKLYEKTDRLLLGGVIYNAFLAAKYDVKIKGVDDEDVKLAKDLVAKDKDAGKILEPGVLVESELLESRDPAKVKLARIKDFKPGDSRGYFLDVAPESFDDPKLGEAIASAKTVFINAVMGFTPNFFEGSQRFYAEVAKNKGAKKLYGGGDTLQELKTLNPGVYLQALEDDSYYFFTGGGAVLTAIEDGAYGIKPVGALLKG
jgi:phosphoglycerate kinase